MNSLVEIVNVFIAIALFEVCIRLYDWRWGKSQKPNINCDNCARPMRLRKTKDGKFWLCLTCRKAYEREVQSEATSQH